MINNVTIIDYNLGNLFSVHKACEEIGLKSKVSSSLEDIRSADAIVLPGVGAFADAMDHLKQLELIEPIREKVRSGAPIFGICLGMHLLFSKSEEFGSTEGLDLVPGEIAKFNLNNNSDRPKKIPHFGWNRISAPTEGRWSNSPFQSLGDGEFMYFVHSFFAKPKDASHSLSETNYCEELFCSSVLRENIFATQFHPEKSGPAGLKIFNSWRENF